MSTLARLAAGAALVAFSATAASASIIPPNPIPYGCRIDWDEPAAQHNIPGVPPVPQTPRDIRCYG